MVDVFDRFGVPTGTGDVFDRVLSSASKSQREAYARTAREEAARLREQDERRKAQTERDAARNRRAVSGALDRARSSPPAADGFDFGRGTAVADDIVGPAPKQRVKDVVEKGHRYGPTITQQEDARVAQARQKVRDTPLEADNAVERAGSKFWQRIRGLGAGGGRAIEATLTDIGLDPDSDVASWLRAKAASGEDYAARPVTGEQTWEALKEKPTAGGLARFVIEQGASSVADMGVLASGAGILPYIGMQSGGLGQQRAVNNADETADATGADVLKALPAATASAWLERLGLHGIFGATAKTVTGRVAQAFGAEAITEAAQSPIEYAGSNLGTEAGFDVREAADQALAGAIAGGALGGTFRATGEGGNAIARRRPISPGIREQASATASEVTQDDIDSPLDTGLIASGRAALASGEAASAADAILARNGAPPTGSRVTVAMPDGSTREGAIADAVETANGDGTAADGVKVRLDDGTLFEHHFDELADAGVTVSSAVPADPAPADADAAEAPSTRAPSPTEASGFVLPVQGRMTSGFGRRTAPKAGASTNHGGVDLAVPVGTPVAAPAAGRVVAVGSDERSGNYVRIDHGDGRVSSFAHLDSAGVKVGDEVAAGSVIARSGNTGNSTGPHLHWSVRQNGKAIDPMSLAQGRSPASAGRPPIETAEEAPDIEFTPIEFATRQEYDAPTTAAPAAPVAGEPVEAVAAPVLLSRDAEPITATPQGLSPLRRLIASRLVDAPADEPAPVLVPASTDEVGVPSPLRQLLEAKRAAAPASTVAAEPGLDSSPAPADVRGEPIDGEWRRFTSESGTLDIPRDQMPQIKAENRGAMVNFLAARGIKHAEDTVAADSLKPTQSEFSEAKVEKAKAFEGGNRAILVSADGHVVDGHHQWLAARDAGEDIRVISLGAPIRDVIDTVRQMPSAETAGGASVSTTPAPQIAADPAPEPMIASTTPSTPFEGAQPLYGEEGDAQIGWFDPASGRVERIAPVESIATPPIAGPRTGTTEAPQGTLFRMIGPVSRLTGEEMGALPADVTTRIPVLRDRAIEHYRANLEGQAVQGEDGVEVIVSRRGRRKATNGKGEDLLAAVPAIPQILQHGTIKDLGPSPKNPALRAYLYSAPVELAGQTRELAVIVREDANGRRTYDLTFDNGSDAAPDEQLSVVGGRYNVFEAGDANLSVWTDQAPPRDLAPVQQQLEQRLAQLGLADKVRVEAVDRLFGDPSIAGSYWRGLAQVALDAGTDAQTTLDHEAVHALRDLGLVTPTEWSVLAAAARADSAVMASVTERYPDLDAEARIEEAVADRFAAWAAGQRQERGAVARAFARIQEVLRAIGQALRGGGFTTDESVMRAIEGGAVGARETASAAASELKQSREVVGQSVPRIAGTLAEARTIARAEIVGRDLVNEATGLVARVSNGTLLKMTSNKAVVKSTTIDDHIAAVVNVDTLFAAAEEDGSHPDRRGEPTIKAIRRFAAPMDGVNGPVSVKMLVKETTGAREPNPLYTVEALAIEMVEPGSVSETSAPEVSPDAAPPGSEADVGSPASDGNGPKFSRTAAPDGAGFFGRRSVEVDAPSPAAVSDLVNALSPKGPLGQRVDTALRAVREAFQDKMLPVQRVQLAIEKATGQKLPDDVDAYGAEELMSGKIGARMERLVDEKVEPLFAALEAEGITVDELESYLYARHAPERNARIASINPEFGPGEGSGMTDAEASSIMSEVDQSGKREALDRLAGRVDEMLREAIDTRVAAGLLSQAEAQSWRAQYEFYVPLRGQRETMGDAEPPAGIRKGSGISIKGKESKRAFGRTSKADDILAYSILQAQEAIVRAETNAVAQSFVALARANPDANFWQVDKVERRPVWNAATGQVSYRAETRISAEDAPFTVTAKVDGDEVRVTMNRTNPEAARVADAMRNLSAQRFDAIVNSVGKFTRFFSSINTRFSPPFIITNAVRDLQTAAVVLQQHKLPGLSRAVVRDWRHALTARKVGDGEWSKWRREFEMAGGKVYFNQHGDLGQIRKDINDRITRASRTGKVGHAWKAFFDGVDNVNEAVERAVRLSVYKNLRTLGGMSPKDAASGARNVTVNFTRKGKFSPFMNSFFAFFNAATQGSANLVLTGIKSKEVRRAMGAMVVAGFALDMLNALISGDDDDGESFWDKVTDEERSRSAILVVGDKGEQIKLPLAYGLNALFALGGNISQTVRGTKRPIEAGLSWARVAADAFNPLGSGGSWWNVIAPTFLDPAAELYENRNFMGAPIVPEKNPFGPKPTPSSNYYQSVTPLSKAIAKAANRATGGDDVVPGAISVSPEVLDYLAGYYTGGVGRFFGDVTKWGMAPFDPDSELEARDFPLVKQVVGGKARWIDKQRFYERRDLIEQQIGYARDYDKLGDTRGLDALLADKASLFAMEEPLKAAKKEMTAIRKDRAQLDLARDLGQIDDATWTAERKLMKEAEDAVIFDFNKAWNAEMRSTLPRPPAR